MNRPNFGGLEHLHSTDYKCDIHDCDMKSW